jgi:hypothetical protein
VIEEETDSNKDQKEEGEIQEGFKIHFHQFRRSKLEFFHSGS